MNLLILNSQSGLPERTEAVPGADPYFRKLMSAMPTQHPDTLLNNIISEIGSAAFKNVYYWATAFSLLQRVQLEALLNHLTTSPSAAVDTKLAPLELLPNSVVSSRTDLQSSIDELRCLSSLTNEEVSSLLGVSRRSLQAWLSGSTISAPKERRLLELLAAFREMTAGAKPLTRQLLLNRPIGGVSAYDLLRDRKFEDAVNLVLNRRSSSVGSQNGSYDLIAQIDHVEGDAMPEGLLNKRFSGRLRRK